MKYPNCGKILKNITFMDMKEYDCEVYASYDSLSNSP